jgi:hypothetical protein
VLAGFVSWLLADARRRGLARLCFSSGSGPVLLELAQLLRGPDDPACSLLHTGPVRRGGGPGLAGAAPDDLLPAYAAQEDLREGVRWALVDLGWSLDTLAALRAALGPAAPELGYALAVAHVRHPLEATGPFVAQVREDVPWGRKVLDGGWLLDAVELVEHLFVSADQGACLGYERRDGRVVPVLGPARPAPAWSAALRRAVLAYARAAREAGLLDDGGAAASAAGLEAGRSFVLHPTREEALLFGATPVPDDPAEAVVRAIAPPLGVEDLVRRVQRRLGRRPDAPERPGHWSAASWAAAPPHVRIAVGVAQRAVPVVRRARGVVRRGVGRAAPRAVPVRPAGGRARACRGRRQRSRGAADHPRRLDSGGPPSGGQPCRSPPIRATTRIPCASPESRPSLVRSDEHERPVRTRPRRRRPAAHPRPWHGARRAVLRLHRRARAARRGPDLAAVRRRGRR